MIGWIWATRSSGYEEFCLLGCNAVQSVESQVPFRKTIWPPSSGSNKHDTSVKAGDKHLLALIQPWKWRQYVPPKCWLTFSRLHVIRSKKTVGTLQACDWMDEGLPDCFSCQYMQHHWTMKITFSFYFSKCWQAIMINMNTLLLLMTYQTTMSQPIEPFIAMKITSHTF
jgi:hypothetical protein